MLEKLKELALRYEDLQAQLADPSVYGDAERLKTVNRELKDLTPVAEAYQAYRQAEADRAAAEELLSDPEMRELAQEELTAAREEMERLRQELKLLLLPKDPNDRKNVILEIRAGTGGEEAALFAASLLRMYTMYAAARGWRTDTVELNETELGGAIDSDYPGYKKACHQGSDRHHHGVGQKIKEIQKLHADDPDVC